MDVFGGVPTDGATVYLVPPILSPDVHFSDVRPTSDGGFVVASTTTHEDGALPMLIKTDSLEAI